jgi:hypothetical protein
MHRHNSFHNSRKNKLVYCCRFVQSGNPWSARQITPTFAKCMHERRANHLKKKKAGGRACKPTGQLGQQVKWFWCIAICGIPSASKQASKLVPSLPGLLSVFAAAAVFF